MHSIQAWQRKKRERVKRFFPPNVGLRLFFRSAAFRVTQSTISFSSIYSVCDSGPTAQFEMCKWSYLGSSSDFIIVESTTVLF